MKSLYSWLIITFFIFLNACTNKLNSELKNENSNSKTPSNKNIGENMINFEKEFKSKERWLKIKKIWKTLSKVEPKENGIYFNTLKKEEQIQVNKDLLEAFGYHYNGLNKPKNISDLEKILYNLINERIGELTYPRELMTRMMAPPTGRLKRTSIIAMEKEIDILIKLKNDKKVESKELAKVLVRVQDNVYMSCILNILKDSRASYSLDLSKVEKLNKIDATIDLWIEKYNESFNKVIKNTVVKEKYLEEYKANNERVQRDLKKIKKLKSKIYNLIEALEAE